MDLILRCPHCHGESLLTVDAQGEAVSCGLCDRLLFEYELASERCGVVYVLSNEEFPGLVKIGCTKRAAAQRAQELNSQTGVPGILVVEAYWRVDDPFESERLIHERLATQRLEGKEFFRMSVAAATQSLADAFGAAPTFSRSASAGLGSQSAGSGPTYPSVDWRSAK